MADSHQVMMFLVYVAFALVFLLFAKDLVVYIEYLSPTNPQSTVERTARIVCSDFSDVGIQVSELISWRSGFVVDLLPIAKICHVDSYCVVPEIDIPVADSFIVKHYRGGRYIQAIKDVQTRVGIACYHLSGGACDVKCIVLVSPRSTNEIVHLLEIKYL